MSNRENICFINNYNNGQFISDCLDSVIAQSNPFDHIFVVDDGSTDNSLEVLALYKAKYSNIKVLEKINGGQLSTFNFIADVIPMNSQVFLLDGDDAYPPDYLELVLSEFNHQPWDFSFCERRDFSSMSDVSLKTAKISLESSINFELSSALTRSRYCWIGNVTSTLSVSGEVFKKIFPVHLGAGSVLPADDLVIYSSSILGAHKKYLKSIAIGWRYHENNHSLKEHSDQYRIQKSQDIEKIFSYYCEKENLERYPSVSEFYQELNALANPLKDHLRLPNHWLLLNRLIRNRYFGWGIKK